MPKANVGIVATEKKLKSASSELISIPEISLERKYAEKNRHIFHVRFGCGGTDCRILTRRQEHQENHIDNSGIHQALA